MMKTSRYDVGRTWKCVAHLLAFVSFLICSRASDCCSQQPENLTKVLTVGTRHIPPFAIKSDEGTWSGVSIGLWKSIAEDLGVRYEFLEFDNVSDLLAAVEQGKVDVGVAALTITAEREEKVDFSLPFHTSGIGVAIRKNGRASFYAAIATLASIEFAMVILLLVVVLFFIGLLSWWFERHRNEEHFDKRFLHGIWDGFWFAAVTMTTVGYGDKSPKSVPGRVLAVVWMFTGLVLISLFTAAAASALTNATSSTRIQRTEDLLKYRCGTLADSTSGRFLGAENISFTNFDDLAEAMSALVDDRIDTVVYDAPTLRYFSHTKFGDSIQVLPVRFQTASYAFALPPNSPVREPINRSLLRRIESPGWADHVQRLLGR